MFQDINLKKVRRDQNLSIISPYQLYINFYFFEMFFTHTKDDKLLYEVDIKIKAYTKITKKDEKRINKIALLIDSLGNEKDTTEKLFRFTSEQENGGLLLDVEDCRQIKS